MDEKLFTVNEVADRLQLNAATVQRWIRDGRLAAINLGGSAGYRIRGEDIEHLLYQEYGRVESLARRAAAAERELADALGSYARGLTGSTQHNVVEWQAEMTALSQKNMVRAERFKDVSWFYRPARTPIVATQQSVATQLKFDLEEQQWDRALNFFETRHVRVEIMPELQTSYWRLGLAFSQEDWSNPRSLIFARPLWHLSRDDSVARLFVDYYDQNGHRARRQTAIEPYNGESVTFDVAASGGRMDISVHGSPGYTRPFGTFYHKYARLFAWADGRPYDLDVAVTVQAEYDSE